MGLPHNGQQHCALNNGVITLIVVWQGDTLNCSLLVTLMLAMSLFKNPNMKKTSDFLLKIHPLGRLIPFFLIIFW
jgi:hypothetical protein